MLAKWIEILPLFIVRWIAKHEAERWYFRVGTTHYVCAMARHDVLIVLVKDDNGIDSIGRHRATTGKEPGNK